MEGFIIREVRGSNIGVTKITQDVMAIAYSMHGICHLMEQNLTREANSVSAGREIPNLFIDGKII
jgi:hypothetical protein